MRKRIWITCTVILVICVLFLLRKAAEESKTIALQQNEMLTNQPSEPKQMKAVDKLRHSNISAVNTGPPRPSGGIEISNAIRQQMQEDWQKPIEFYGKVLDQNSNAVAGAGIQFRWADMTENVNMSSTQSDNDGLFSLHGKLGRSLHVWVGKEGYYASHGGEESFLYSLADNIFAPDPQNPVVFNLRKKGNGEALVSMKQNYAVSRDGSPLGIDLTTGKTTPNGSGDLVVQCWTQDAGKPSGAKYDWRCVLTIPSGGIVSTDEEFAFLAPESGYTLSTEIAMPAERPGWQDQVDLKFFYRLADGRYGRMKFSMIAGGHHFCMIDSVLNPSGSRNLEPAN